MKLVRRPSEILGNAIFHGTVQCFVHVQKLELDVNLPTDCTVLIRPIPRGVVAKFDSIVTIHTQQCLLFQYHKTWLLNLYNLYNCFFSQKSN